MAKKDKLNLLGSEVCNDYLGFTPTSNSVKPPHIANGLFREITNEVCDFTDVHEWIVSERKSKALSSEEIILKYKDILWQGEKEDPANIKEIRFLLDDIFNPDNTVYPSYPFSVANISSHWLVKESVTSEVGLGGFIFEILAKKIEGKRSPAIELIKQALANDTDDLTKIIKPIIVFPSQEEKREVGEETYPSDEEIRWNDCKKIIRMGFDNLAENMIRTGDSKNSLIVLERMVNYSCFAAFYYLININAVNNGAESSPILIDAGGDIDSIKKASELCYSRAKTSVEDYYIESINAILHIEVAKNSKESCEEWMQNMVFSDEEEEEEISNALKSYFGSFCDDGDNPIHALAHALQIVLYTFRYKKNSSPSEFCRVLGVRCGLIGPRGNRATVKRYLISSFMLETLTYSILSADDIEDGIELKDLSRKFTDAYNILLGADVDNEYQILESANVAQSTPGDLRGEMSVNAQHIAETYISMGMAHRYADGVTIIGRRD